MTKARDIASAAPAPSTVSATEIGYLDGVSSAIQTQIDGKSSTSHNHNSTYVANSLVDAKGDLLVGSANDTVSRLAVASTAGYLLSVDSAEATGLKWAAPAAPSFVGCRIRKTGTQNITNNTYTALAFNDTDDFDTDAFHDPASNSTRITIPSGKAGKYLIIGNWTTGTDPTNQRRIFIYKNGSQQGGSVQTNAASNDGTGLLISMILDLAVGDYVETYVWQNSGQTVGTNAANTTMMAQFLGA